MRNKPRRRYLGIYYELPEGSELRADLISEIFKAEKYPSVKSPLTWTGDKINLVELAYALYLSKDINHGNIGITHFFDQLSKCFNIEFNTPRRCLQDMAFRKRKSPTCYMEKLTSLVKEKIDYILSL